MTGQDRSDCLDVLIVGAGPTGLALACQLAELGIRPRIIDRQPNTVRESRALAIQPRTLEVLRNFGVTQELIKRGNSTVELRMHFNEKVIAMPLFDVGLDDTQFPFLLFLSQAETEVVLAEHLASRGITVQREVELVSLDQDVQTVTCTLRHSDGREEHVRTHYVVGCDGAHSIVRHQAGISFVGDAYPQTFVLADVEADGNLELGAVHAFPGGDGMLFFFPLARPATWRMIGMRPPSPAGVDLQESSAVSLHELQDIVDTFTAGQVQLRDPVWLTKFRIPHRQAAKYRAGRIFIAGDAAHVHSPAGAQGMNTGIQDAINLGWKLALVIQGKANAALLDTYQDERWPIGRTVLRFTNRAFKIVTSSHPIVQFVRTHVASRVAPLGLRLTAARRKGFRTISQLAINYRHSPVTQEGLGLANGLRPGDRLPDTPVIWQGKSTWLHDVLSGSVFKLLLCGSAEGWPQAQITDIENRWNGVVDIHYLVRQSAPQAMSDSNGLAFSRLGIQHSAHLLVRPDGYVAYQAVGNDVTGLINYLRIWFPASTE